LANNRFAVRNWCKNDAGIIDYYFYVHGRRKLGRRGESPPPEGGWPNPEIFYIDWNKFSSEMPGGDVAVGAVGAGAVRQKRPVFYIVFL
jgi:hypothetical protein